MFSYRHAFHAGNHADVLKHATLIAVLRYMTEKPVPLTVVDTHAGAGLYRLDGDAAATSGDSRRVVLEGACGDRDDGRREEADCDAKGTRPPCSKVDGAQRGVFRLAV